MPFTICTFNVNNLFVRYRFGRTYPGDMGKKSAIEEPGIGYLPMYNPANFDLFDENQRRIAARAITRDGNAVPDILCLQEVESLIALRRFNEVYLKSAYPYALLLDSRDLRQIDVAVLSTLPISAVRSHMDELDPKGTKKSPWLFSRDCLEVEFQLDATGNSHVTLFVNHLKSQYIDWASANTPAKKAAARKRADEHRERQAERVVQLVNERFPGQQFKKALFAVVGDLNDGPGSSPLQPLLSAGLTNALDRIATPEARWTHWYKSESSVSQLDYLLLSPALEKRCQGVIPEIERRGVGFARILTDGKPGPKSCTYQRFDADPAALPVDFRFPRFSEVSPEDYASDHCPVFLEIP